MITVAKYSVMYAVTYLIFVLISLAMFGEPRWLYSAALLFTAEVFRVFIALFNPGYEKRLVEKYGSAGIRFAEKLRKGRR
ncbi:MAG: hypothetical protein HYZ40_15235 [Rhodospirillales bacterium]|nr:hypothetical protein [Rhodospirillales bacterium]